MTSAMTVARKELLDLRRSRLLALLLTFLVIAAVVSVLVQAAQFRVTAQQYQQYVAALQAAGGQTAPAAAQLFPLQLLRGSIEYVEIIGALFAIVVGYGTVAKEKQRATSELLFTRPIRRHTVAAGKVLALAVAWLATVAGLTTALALTLIVAGHATLTSTDLVRLAIGAVASWIYLVLWSALAMAMASAAREPTGGLVAVLVLWLVVVLVLPQVGDTMDPDNQVPGGLFLSLHVPKGAEHAVMAHFSGYETARNTIEVTSVTKHYERLTFAVLGIKDTFNQLPVAQVLTRTLPNLLTLTGAGALCTALAMLTTTRRSLLRRQS